MVSCGGGSGSKGGSKGGKIPNGTYVYVNESRYERFESSFIISGNKYEIVKQGLKMEEGTYELVEEYKEKDFSRGFLTFNNRSGEYKANYSIEGNNLTIGGTVFTKR